MDRPVRLLLMALALLAAGPALGQSCSDPPTRTSITLDGLNTDWAPVLANPRNTAFDGDGSTVNCLDSPDRDCAIGKSGVDIYRAALTWDDTNLYFYIERDTSTPQNRSFIVYIDVDNDGVLEVSDLMIELDFKGNQRQVTGRRYYYSPSGPTGDPIADAQGYADGYTLPGGPLSQIFSPPDPPMCDVCGSTDGLRFEFAYPWATLGIAPGTPVGYHFSSGTSIVDVGDDNAAGSDRRAATTGFVELSAFPDQYLSSPPINTVRFVHVADNAGNEPAWTEFTMTSAVGLQVRLLHDLDVDGFPDGVMATDAQGDGSFSSPQDFIDPSWDQDGDTIPDALIAAGGQFGFVVEVEVTNRAKGELDTITTQLHYEDMPCAFVRDTLGVGYVTILPPRDFNVEPGIQFPVPHVIESELPTAGTFDLTYASQRGWGYTFYTDPNGDGDRSDGTALFDSNGDTNPDINLAAWEVAPIVLEGIVPPGEPFETEERVILTVEGDLPGSPTGQVEDVFHVYSTLTLAPDHSLGDGTAKSAGPGSSVTFRHTLTYNGPLEESFTLTALSTEGFVVTFFTDPNGDGSPADGALLPEPVNTGMVDPRGGTFPFVVRVDVPPGTPVGTLDTTTVYAVSDTTPGLLRAVQDQTQVGRVQVYDSLLYTNAITHVALCEDAHGRALGLVPSQAGRYTLRWYQGSPEVLVRSVAVPSDFMGEAFDSLPLDAGWSPGPGRLVVEELGSEIDSVSFTAELAGTADALFTDSAAYGQAGDTVTLTARLANPNRADLYGTRLHFRLLNEAGDRILDPGSWTFVPFTGAESTRVLEPIDILSDDSREEVLSFTNVLYPTPGVYRLAISWEASCGIEILYDSVAFDVVADRDGDGLDDVDEPPQGTDPDDADTDDDGLLDGEEVHTHASDPLLCDSDGDGLLDGLEAGKTEATRHPDTDPSAGCWKEDADPSSTTLPAEADTDGGGLQDGQEDMDADGLVDSMEKDPLFPDDDPCEMAPPAEIQGVALRRSGGDVVLAWAPGAGADPCADFEVLTATTLPPGQAGDFSLLATGLSIPGMTHMGVVNEGARLRSYLVRESSWFAGPGALGHYAQ